MVAIQAYYILSELLKHVESKNAFQEDQRASVPNDKNINVNRINAM